MIADHGAVFIGPHIILHNAMVEGELEVSSRSWLKISDAKIFAEGDVGERILSMRSLDFLENSIVSKIRVTKKPSVQVDIVLPLIS